MRKYQVKANYHTHTTRCHHATGEDREYVEAAIASGLKILGFSDHSPYPTGTDFVSGIRMTLEETEGYFRSLEALREEYKNDIDIYIGVEAEYYPQHFSKLTEFMKDYPLDYMILGQHFVPEEDHGRYTGREFKDKAILDMYIDYVIEAMKTGKFAYVAHPDLVNYDGEDKDEQLRAGFRRMCKAAKELNVPLEINVLGYMRGIQYPSNRLLEIAAECGNDVILGMDVHNPKHFEKYDAIDACVDLAKTHGLHLLEQLDLKRNNWGQL